MLQPLKARDQPGGVSAATVRRRLSIVSGFFAFLQARGDVTANPVPRGLPTRRERSRPGQGVPLVRAARRLPRILSPAEVDAPMAALRTHRDRTMVAAMVVGRLRRCEVLGLRLEDLHVAAFAPSPPVLIAARAFLAVGAAAMLPATSALIRITFDDEHERGIAIGVWGTMAVLGAALGPIVGGLLLQHFWWGSVFLLNIPVALLALAATAALVPGGSGHRDRPWDLIASLQAMVALAGLVYAVQEAAKPDPVPLAIALALLAAAAGCWMFLRRQRRQAYPLIDFSLFRNRSLLTGVTAAALSMAATAGTELVLTQRLQLVVGLTPLHAGLIVTAFAAGSLPVGVLAGGLLHRTGARPLIGGGLLLGALGALVTLLLTPGAVPLLGGGRSPAWVVPGLVLAGAGLGIVMVAASVAIISGAPPQRAGMASSIESVSYEARQPRRHHRPGNNPHRRLHRHDPPPRNRPRPGRRQHRSSPRRRRPPPRRPSPRPAGRRRQRLRQRLHPRPGHHRHRPGRGQRLHLPLPQAAARYPRRTGPAPAPRTGPARRVAAAAPVLAGERDLGDRRHVHALRRQQHHLRPPPGHHRPAAPADDLHQPPALIIVDLTHPQPLSHQPSLDDRRSREKPRSGANVTCYGISSPKATYSPARHRPQLPRSAPFAGLDQETGTSPAPSAAGSARSPLQDPPRTVNAPGLPGRGVSGIRVHSPTRCLVGSLPLGDLGPLTGDIGSPCGGISYQLPNRLLAAACNEQLGSGGQFVLIHFHRDGCGHQNLPLSLYLTIRIPFGRHHGPCPYEQMLAEAATRPEQRITSRQ